MAQSMTRKIFILAILYYFFAIITEFCVGTLAVWPAAGLALAGVMVFGNSVWPGVMLGTLMAVATHFLLIDIEIPFLSKLLIIVVTASGNTVATVLANLFNPASLFDKCEYNSFQKRIGRFFAAIFFVGLFAAIPGVGVYFLLEIPIPHNFILNVLGWTTASAIGAVVVVPFLYLAWYDPDSIFKVIKSCEGMTVLGLICIFSYYILGPGYGNFNPVFAQPSLLMIPLLWIVLRMTPAVVATYNMLLFMISWVFTSSGYGYFSSVHSSGPETAMLIGLSSIYCMTLILDTVLTQRQKEQEKQTYILERAVAKRTAELEKAKLLAEELALTDPLTDMNNRRSFFLYGEQIVNEAKRSGKVFSVVMVDIDHFKKVNDTFGHDVGDKAIIALSDSIRKVVRDSDVAGRLGGEEFAVIIPESDMEGSQVLAERLKSEISSINIPTDQGAVNFTASLGIALKLCDGDTLDLVLKRADAALYQAKNQGRNRIVVAS